jgi:hypothetical protein
VPHRANGTQHQVQLASTEFMDGLGQHFANLSRGKVLTGQTVQSNLHQSNLSKGGLFPGAASARGMRPAGEYKPPDYNIYTDAYILL